MSSPACAVKVPVPASVDELTLGLVGCTGVVPLPILIYSSFAGAELVVKLLMVAVPAADPLG